ncbi:MAG TPA: hypothetical protein VMF31_00605 [Solirubrobacterales bacterium]|nr:hypothetical protein [Solirubrobacterales bacterium]
MKAKLRAPSPGTVIAVLALFVALGGTAYGISKNSVRSSDIAPNAVKASDLGALKLRPGKIRDFDQDAGDGEFHFAGGRARCKRGEKLISGGLRSRRTPEQGPIRTAMVESGPITKTQQWSVAMYSDLGGDARDQFVVFAYCLVR